MRWARRLVGLSMGRAAVQALEKRKRAGWAAERAKHVREGRGGWADSWLG